MLAGAGLMFVFSVQALFGSTFGLFMVPLGQELGWSRADIAFSLTLTTAIAWLSLLVAGWLADHVRLRPLLFAGVMLGAANLAAFAAMHELWHFYLLVLLLAFSALGASPLILSKLVQGWFDKRLGSALGLLFASASIGTVLHPLLISAALQRAGWRIAFVAMGALALVGGLIALLALVREPPRKARAAPVPSAPAVERLPMIAFLRDSTWWRLAAWNLLFGFGGGAIGLHFAALLHDRGVGPGAIGLALSLTGASHFAGNLLAGWLVDRIPPQRMAWLLMTLPLAAALLLLGSAELPLMLFAAAVLGLASGSDGSLSAFLARFYFGSRLYGQATSTQMLATAIGAGVAPWISGLLRDRTGDYALSLTCAAAAFALAIVAGALLPRRGHPPETAPLSETPAPQPAHA